MKSRPLADSTSWRFYGAIHGIDPQIWARLGYLNVTEPLPGKDIVKKFWSQCQHGTWYFLPWHRGYVLAFEQVVRAAIIKLGGPADWALPYWNYFKPGQDAMPAAFSSPDWPDGKGNNPLFVPQRYGPNDDGHVYVPSDQVNLNAMTDPEFTGSAIGGSPGFGGVDTGFSHGGRVHGALESQPHDMVHVLVGGQAQDGTPGLMSDPDTAGLDPIFWLHHSNIDRLWEVWRRNPSSHVDPTDPNWVKGPASIGDRAFAMPLADGSTWTYTPGQMGDLAKLSYTYDDLSPVGPPSPLRARLMRLRALAPTQEGPA
jgi:tyrosinase